MIGIGRIAAAAAFVTAGLAFAEAHGARAGADVPASRPAPLPVAAAPSPGGAPDAEKPACPRVKVVYFGHGEAERSPCRTAPR